MPFFSTAKLIDAQLLILVELEISAGTERKVLWEIIHSFNLPPVDESIKC